MDSEKIIKDLEGFRKTLFEEHDWYEESIVSNAIELLKEQQPKKPVYDCPLIRCPRCKNSINVIQKYCDECGQAIDWSKDGEQE